MASQEAPGSGCQLLSDYAKLIRRLLPDVCGIAFFDPTARLIWSDQDALSSEVQAEASALLDESSRNDGQRDGSIVSLSAHQHAAVFLLEASVEHADPPPPCTYIQVIT